MSPERNGLRGFVLIASLLVAATAQAATPSAVKITADTLELDQKAQSTTYSGDVLLTQGEMRLTADSLTAFVVDGKLGRIVAEGHPARFESRLDDGTPVVGEANRIRFDAVARRLILSGNGRLSQGRNRIENDHIEYDLANGNLKAGGSQAKKRVEVIFQPAQ